MHLAGQILINFTQPNYAFSNYKVIKDNRYEQQGEFKNPDHCKCAC